MLHILAFIGIALLLHAFFRLGWKGGEKSKVVKTYIHEATRPEEGKDEGHN